MLSIGLFKMGGDKDNKLITLIKSDDQKALEQLHKKYYFSLCNFSLQFVKNKSYAEEIVSDVFLNIWLKRETLSIRSNVKSYLFAATRNRALNFLKTPKVEFREINETHQNSTTTDLEPDAELHYSDTLNRIEKIINDLPPQRRIIFKLNRIDGLKYKEIAEVLSISVNTVQKQMTEALKHIAKYYSNIHLILFSFFKRAKQV